MLPSDHRREICVIDLARHKDNGYWETLIYWFDTATTDAATEIHWTAKKPSVTADILDLCDKQKELKDKKTETEGAMQYREVIHILKNSMLNAKEAWNEDQC